MRSLLRLSDASFAIVQYAEQVRAAGRRGHGNAVAQALAQTTTSGSRPIGFICEQVAGAVRSWIAFIKDENYIFLTAQRSSICKYAAGGW